MKRIRAILVDDEDLARESLRMAIGQFRHVVIIEECPNGFEAVRAVKEHQPDVMFLDIQMPKLTGFDVVELLGDEAPVIIFVTAYDEFAVKAFEANALDYILKPANPERLVQTIEKIERLMGEEYRPRYDAILSDYKAKNKPLKRVLIRDKSKVHIIPVETIVYIQAQGDYVRIQTEQDTYLKQERMANLEQRLDPALFQRVHRSYLLNITFIDRIEQETKDSKIAILKNRAEIPISRSGYEQLMKFL